nr:putative ribonuclease H-like domain-containing protein [Tanacetum cinerariifolium]
MEAMQEELLQFKLQEVWTMVDLPFRKRAIGTNYDEVFAPVARIETIRLSLDYASFKDFVVYQMNVKSDFLYEKIEEEEVYVCQPPGFEDRAFPDKVYKVEKALYELHQAPRAWYETLSIDLLNNGFHRGKIDKTLFIRMYKDDILLVQVYVDDIIFGSTKKELCSAFEKMMHEKFQMSFMGELTFFLGLQIFRCQECKNASTPMETHKPLLKDEDGKEVDVHMYRSMIGSLMYLISSRPDIMFAVCACARYQVNPKVSHLHVVKRIFKNLKGHPKLGLWYPKDSPFDLVAYTDSDYAGASLDRNSTTGGCQYLDATGKAKIVNGEAQLQALVDGKKVIITESIIRRDLQLEDAEGVDCLSNAAIFEQLTLMGLERAATTATSLDVEQNIGEPLRPVLIRNQLRSDDDMCMYALNVSNMEPKNVKGADRIVLQEPDKSTTTTTTATTPTSKVQDKGKGIMVEPEMPMKKKDQIKVDYELAQRLQAEEQDELTDVKKARLFVEFLKKRRKFFVAKRTEEKRNRPSTKAQQRSLMYTYLKNIDGWKPKDLRYKSFAEIQELFNKTMKRINTFVNFRTELVEGSTKKDEVETTQESSSKRERDELEQERSKKQKVEDDKESEKLKKCLEITLDDGDDVTMDATPLYVKSLTIVDYKIYNEGKKSYIQIFKADGNSQMYLTFSKMLKNFNKEDLEVLWRLVKARFEKVQPVDHMDSFLMHNLKTMFEHHVKDNVRKDQQGLAKVKNKKLYDSCRVHCVTMQNILYYLLVEKMYPLTNHTLHQMFNDVMLQVDYECKMAYELLRLVKK